MKYQILSYKYFHKYVFKTNTSPGKSIIINFFTDTVFLWPTHLTIFNNTQSLFSVGEEFHHLTKSGK